MKIFQTDIFVHFSKMFFLKLRYQILRREIIRGWYEIPYIYFIIGGFVLSGSIVAYKTLVNIPVEDRYVRYKNRYLVVRPDDVRLDKYPLSYITDKDLLLEHQKK